MIHPPSADLDERVMELFASCMGNPTEDKIRSIWREYLTSANRHLYFLCEQEKTVGLIGIEMCDGSPTLIRHIAVVRDRRSNGFGRMMIEQVFVSALIAETDRDAVGFYRRCGFSVENLGVNKRGTERFQCFRARGASRPRVSAAVLRTGGAEVLMVKHVWPDGSTFWQFPGGGVAPGETLEEAVVRELEEETGLVGRCPRRLFALPYEKGISTTFLVEVDEGAVATLGVDPEDAGSGHKKLVAIAWMKTRAISDNAEVRELLKHL